MTTYDGLVVGNAYAAVSRVTGADQVTGWTLRTYGPSGTPLSVTTVTPAGVIAGNLTDTPANLPVQLVPAFATVTPGDVLQNITSGETYVARQVRIMPDGTYQWAASLTGIVWYTMGGWTIAGHVNL
jgi:hypothetical protein